MQKSVYETKIAPRLRDIKTWIGDGFTVEEIAKNLGISRKTLYNHSKNHPELRSLLDDRSEANEKLYGAMMKAALGYIATDQEIMKEEDPEGRIIKRIIKSYKRAVGPNVSAIHLLLKNWDKLHWSNDPAELDIKKGQLRLAEKAAEREEQPEAEVKPLEIRVVDASIDQEAETS